MKFLKGRYNVELKDHRYKIHPTWNIILGERDLLKSRRTQYQVQNNTQIRRNQKVFKNDNDELVVKNCPKNKQSTPQQPKFKPLSSPSCNWNVWLEFVKSYFCQNWEYTIIKQKHQIDKKVLRQDFYFSTRLSYANKKIRETYYSIVNTR